MSKNALLEIGSEEIPASYIEPACRQLLSNAQALCSEHRLRYQHMETYATPRRIALFIDKLDEKSEDRVEEALGPAVKVGRDEKGNFTKAAEGFAARHGISAAKLAVKTTEKGDYFCVQKKIHGDRAEKLLQQILPELINRISFPKTMVWEKSHFKFARPVRTLIALYGDKPLRLSVAGVKSGNWTTGLHTVSKKKIVVSAPERYLTVLRNNCVIANPEERKEVLKKAIDAAAKRAKGSALEDQELLSEVNYLIEHPVAVLGEFDQSYLKLPPEVLITCMRKKQKYFPIIDENGTLTNSFVGVRNGISEHQEVVREGYERVLEARLADAAFFFHNDTKAPLAEKVEKLKGVNFQEKLGTMQEKVARVKQLAHFIAHVLKAPVEADHIDRAVDLAKADLVTEMVFEFGELQGVMGRIYARHDGEPEAVWKAVEEHYWPLNAEGKLPETILGTVLSLADKFDTLTVDFTAGLIPSGSQDPYGLRRMSVGILRMILEKNLSLSIKDLVDKAFVLLPADVKQNTAAPRQVVDFLRQRLENLFQAEGFRIDEVRAVLASGADNALDVKRRLDAVKQIRTRPDFEPLAGAFKRAANILKQADKMKLQVPDAPSIELCQEEAEKALLAAIQQMESEVLSLLARQDYTTALAQMVSLKPKVDEFFEKVMVMAEDEKVKANRLALLKYTVSIFFKILDFSQLQG